MRMARPKNWEKSAVGSQNSGRLTAYLINTQCQEETDMAKVLEEIIIIKLSRMVKDSAKDQTVIDAEQRKLIEETVPTLIDEVLGDGSVVVEVAELE